MSNNNNGAGMIIGCITNFIFLIGLAAVLGGCLNMF